MVVISGKKGNPYGYSSSRNRQSSFGYPSTMNASVMGGADQLDDIIDKMGTASSKAQGLGTIITTAAKLFGSDNNLYLKVENDKVIGLLKVGPRQLFIRGASGDIKQITPLCVLDFYVHESAQRGGHGKHLFEYML